MRGVCTCASVQLIGNGNWKPYIFSNYWRSRITNFRHRSPEYIFAFPGPRFWFIPLASGRSNPVSRQQSLRIPDFRRYFSSQIPDPEIRVPFERTKKSKEKLKQRNNQSKATYTNFYLFIFIVFRDRFWTGHKFVTQTCWLKTWPLLINTVLECHSLYIMLLPVIQRHIGPWMRFSVFTDTDWVCSGMLRTKHFAIFCRILIFFTLLVFGQTNAEGRKTFNGWVWSVLVLI